MNSVSKETKSYFTSDSESRNIEVENSEKKKSFECPRCSKCFGTKQILKNHLNRKKRCLQLNPEPVQYSGFQVQNAYTILFERELALLVALQGESIWKGCSAGGGDVH